LLDDPLPRPPVDSPLELEGDEFEVPPVRVVPEGPAPPTLFDPVLGGVVEFPRSSPQPTRNVVATIAEKNDLTAVLLP
jgi:hypothetical protein